MTWKCLQQITSKLTFTSAPVARVQPWDRVRVQHGRGRGEGDSAGGGRVRVVPRQQMDRLLGAVRGRNEVRI